MAVRSVVLAAGQGTRMKSAIPKVLHEVAGRPMIRWVLDSLQGVELDQVVVVVGYGAELVEAALPDGVETAFQEVQLGTGHATQVALDHIGPVTGDTVLVMAGDTPLLQAPTIEQLVGLRSRTGSAVSLLTAEIPDPTGYGRVLRDPWGRVVQIVEHGDASAAELSIQEVNGGVYAFDGEHLAKALSQLGSRNQQGEYYLPDVVAVFSAQTLSLSALRTNPEELAGVNSHDQLAEVEAVMRRRINREWMAAGVWMEDPERTYVHADVTLAPGVRLYANVHLEGATNVGAGAVVGPDVFARDSDIGPEARVWYAVLREAVVGEEAEVGPYASVRPGSVLGARSKVGTFVETKNAELGEGAKVPHLSYMGDARIGRDANVGAGTVTCNYDGVEKHETVIGDRAFIGSDTMLVAPVDIGADATTGAGSTITRDVAPGALAVERSTQREIPGYADRRRERQRRKVEET